MTWPPETPPPQTPERQQTGRVWTRDGCSPHLHSAHLAFGVHWQHSEFGWHVWDKSPGIPLRFPPSEQEPESPQCPKGLQQASFLNPFDVIPCDLIFSTPNGNPMETGRRTKILQKRLRESTWTAPSHRNWPWHVRQRRADALLPELRCDFFDTYQNVVFPLPIQRWLPKT